MGGVGANCNAPVLIGAISNSPEIKLEREDSNSSVPIGAISISPEIKLEREDSNSPEIIGAELSSSVGAISISPVPIGADSNSPEIKLEREDSNSPEIELEGEDSNLSEFFEFKILSLIFLIVAILYPLIMAPMD